MHFKTPAKQETTDQEKQPIMIAKKSIYFKLKNSNLARAGEAVKLYVGYTKWE